MRVTKKGIRPNDFAAFILEHVDLDAWIDRYSGQSPPVSRTAAKSPSRQGQRSRVAAGPGSSGWSKDRFLELLEVAKATSDFTGPLCLLVAYAEIGPRPTSEDLRTACGFEDEEQWQQELRAAKARLTIMARKMNLPSLFPRAQTSDGRRLHPVEPALYPWLKEWHNSDEQRNLPRPTQWSAESKDTANGKKEERA